MAILAHGESACEPIELLRVLWCLGVYHADKFKVTGVEEDAYIASTSAATGTPGVLFDIEGSEFAGNASAALSSTARMENGFYLVREGRTETFTLTIALDPDTAGTYLVRLDSIRFNDVADLSGSTTYSVSNDSEFRTDPVYIAN